MKAHELSLLRQDLSEVEIEKLKIVLAFYERIPCELLKDELLVLMETQPLLAPAEFDRRLDAFAKQVRLFIPAGYGEASTQYATPSQIH
jgi:hypothetical protein